MYPVGQSETQAPLWETYPVRQIHRVPEVREFDGHVVQSYYFKNKNVFGGFILNNLGLMRKLMLFLFLY